MAILKSVVNVNNGNTGWTRKDVIDALETVFANLGWHGGSQVNGVPSRAQSPAGVIGNHDSWRQCGGGAIPIVSYKERHFYVKNTGTTSYRMLEQYYANWYDVNATTNEIVIYRHGLQTGDPIIWGPGETDSSRGISGLNFNTTYYVIKVNNDTIKLASTSADAGAGTNVELNNGFNPPYASQSTTISFFRRNDSVIYDNYEINTLMGDVLNFYVDAAAPGGLYLCVDSDNYDEQKYPYTNIWGAGDNNRTSASGLGTATVRFDTLSWDQSNNFLFPSNHVSSNGYGLKKYIYANNLNSSMKGIINILPSVHNRYSWQNPYWLYTIPASGSRSALTIQVYRYQQAYNSAYRGRISEVYIVSQGFGWTNNESVTIPGTSIGGSSPSNDLIFGVQTSGSVSNGDGKATIQVTNLGGGSNFFQKHPEGSFAILKNINNSSKKYGTTYYSFSTDINNEYRMYINSGSGWNWLNSYGEGAGGIGSDHQSSYGYFTGVHGLDSQQSYNYAARSDTSFTNFNYATTSTPTAYPLSIRTYRAQSPQDQNFAIIQFTQTINGSIIPFGTFTIHKGSTFGSNIWDLEHLYIGTYTQYDIGSRDIYTYYRSPGRYAGSSIFPNKESTNQFSKSREASYGFLRDDYGELNRTRYTCNIDTDVDNNNNQHISIYYRNSTYDGYGISPEANYYKPIKGLPIDNGLVPCPYYMPDDFAMLQVSTTPGLTEFRPGDTITISPSEVYEIILAGYQTQQNGLDNINNNSTIGMLLMARTT